MLITLIIGLPSSGKTTYAKTLNGFLVDDPKSVKELPEMCDHLVITDPNFCVKNALNNAIKYLQEKYQTNNIKKIYFENNPQQCLKNCKKEKPVENYIKYLSTQYVVDNSCVVFKCYEGNSND